MEQPAQLFSAEKILALWETAGLQHPLDRALTILAAAEPGTTRDALADLSIGERDARLLRLRTLFSGSHAAAFAECPRCAERLEFALETSAFAAPNESSDSAKEIEISHGRFRFRLPNSRDLAAVVSAPDSRQALRTLVERCLSPNDGKLPNDAVEALSRAIIAADPRAEISLSLSCPACAHCWNLLFDIGEYFWTEISAQARRLLREIDALARTYGWSEREILGLSPRRRQTYLEMIAA